MIEALTSAFGLAFLAELGDKSMLFSLAAATRYRWWVVLLPVAVATALLSGLAVLVGAAAGEVLPDTAVAAVAGALFLGFGVWSLIDDDDGEDEDVETARHGAWRIMVTLGAVFFLAEFGDKTQIGILALAGLHQDALVGVWAGSVLGMVGTNAIAIAAGSRLERYLPRRVIRLAAAGIFIAFGVVSLIVAFR